MEQQQQEQAVPNCTFTASSKQDLDSHRLPATSLVLPTTGSSSSDTQGSAWRGGWLNSNVADDDESRRKRVKRHRSQVLVVPDKWSQEEMLKEWLDFASFDALLAPKGFDLARAALVAERRQQAKEAMESRSRKAYLGTQFSVTRCIRIPSAAGNRS